LVTSFYLKLLLAEIGHVVSRHASRFRRCHLANPVSDGLSKAYAEMNGCRGSMISLPKHTHVSNFQFLAPPPKKNRDFKFCTLVKCVKWPISFGMK